MNVKSCVYRIHTKAGSPKVSRPLELTAITGQSYTRNDCCQAHAASVFPSAIKFTYTTLLGARKIQITFRDASSDIATVYELDGLESIPGRCKTFLLFFIASRPALESIQPPIQWVLGTLSGGNSVNLTTLFHAAPRLRMVEIYLNSPRRLNAVCSIN
jgi:hypothetical protein